MMKEKNETRNHPSTDQVDFGEVEVVTVVSQCCNVMSQGRKRLEEQCYSSLPQRRQNRGSLFSLLETEMKGERTAM